MKKHFFLLVFFVSQVVFSANDLNSIVDFLLNKKLIEKLHVSFVDGYKKQFSESDFTCNKEKIHLLYQLHFFELFGVFDTGYQVDESEFKLFADQNELEGYLKKLYQSKLISIRTYKIFEEKIENKQRFKAFLLKDIYTQCQYYDWFNSQRVDSFMKELKFVGLVDQYNYQRFKDDWDSDQILWHRDLVDYMVNSCVVDQQVSFKNAQDNQVKLCVSNLLNHLIECSGLEVDYTVLGMIDKGGMISESDKQSVRTCRVLLRPFNQEEVEFSFSFISEEHEEQYIAIQNVSVFIELFNSFLRSNLRKQRLYISDVFDISSKNTLVSPKLAVFLLTEEQLNPFIRTASFFSLINPNYGED